MKTGIDLDKLARLQMAADMRLFRLRGLSERIIEESRNAAAELVDATRGARDAFSTADPIEKVLASLTAELTAMRTSGAFNAMAHSAAGARIEAAKRCAGHRARVAAMISERARLEPLHHGQTRLLRNLNTFAGVQQ
jgi:hypothetical protein